jgi:polar amino acid transport system substrate-binding protein
VPKDKPEFRDAILAALIEIQSSGMEAAMLKKWSLDSGTLEAPHLLTD